MKKIVVFLLIASFIFPLSYAQIPWTVSELRCGNGQLDRFEMCDKNASENRCDAFASLLKIASGCDVAHCTCLPRVNKLYCGNNRRESVEVCDGTGEDLCPQLGNLTNMSLVCDPKTCGCAIQDSVPTDYNPLTVEMLKTISETPSVCGNKKVERAEACDPPDTVCTTAEKKPGICTDKCTCVSPQAFGSQGDQSAQVQQVTTENKTVQDAQTVQESSKQNLTTENETLQEPLAQKDESPGFFGSIWSWFVGIFS